MITTQIKTLERIRAKADRLERTIQSKLSKELSALPEQYGFDDVASFLRAVGAASRGRSGKGRRGRPKKRAQTTRKRAKITDATRAKVKSLVKAGKSGAQIAKAVGISLPSVQNIKKALGLVKAKAKGAQRISSRSHAGKKPVKAKAAPVSESQPPAGVAAAQ